MDRFKVNIQEEDFDAGRLSRELRGVSSGIGAVVTFTGLVRATDSQQGFEEPIRSLYLEHYPGMTEKSLHAIVAEARQRWDLVACTVVHRVGNLQPADQIVFVGTASGHRGDAFEAAEFIMDYLKTRAPFWKRQESATGAQWVAHRESDAEAASRWSAVAVGEDGHEKV